MKLGLLALSCALGAAGAAHAEPGGVSGVSSPVVSPGGLKFEARTAAFGGGALDGDWAHRAQAGYSFNDWWRSTLILRASQPEGESIDLRSVGFEQVFEFTPSADWPVQFGALAEYKAGVNGADDAVEVKLLMERRDGPINARLNLNAQRAVGDDVSDDWAPAYAARVMWRASEQFSFGLEAYGEPDAHAHYWGPRAGVTFGRATLSGGYLVGFDDAQADGQFRLALEFTP